MKSSSWFIPLSGDEKSSVRLFAFPYSGGNASSYATWKDWMPQEVTTLAVQLPGRAMRIAEPLIADMEVLVDTLVPHMLPLLGKPYQLFGHSNGALMAFAVANRLARLGARLPDRIILSGKRSPTILGEFEQLSTLPESTLLKRLQEFGGTPAEFLENIELMRFLLPSMRSDFSLGETFRLGPVQPTLASIPTLLLAGEEDIIPVSDVFAWSDIFARSSRITLKGRHFFINTDSRFPDIMIRFLLAKIPDVA